MRISAIPAILLAAGSILTSACGQEEPAVQEAPEAPAGIEVSNGRLMLPAVAGNPAVVYFDITNNSDSGTVIRAVSVPGAGSVAMHETTDAGGQMSMNEIIQVSVQAGESLSFDPGGYHVMVMEPDATLAAGGTTEVTLTFVGGDKISFPAEIRAAGDER